MINWIVSACILIVAVIALRTVLKGKIAPSLQYALWGLVLIRLLLPIQFGNATFSVSNLTESIKQTPALQSMRQMQIPSKRYEDAHAEVLQQFADAGVQPEYIMEEELQQNIAELMEGTSISEIIAQVALVLWIGGTLVVAGLFLYTNLRFHKQLMFSRQKLDALSVNLPVYITDKTDTPCLFGILRPAIYVTPAAAQDNTLLQYAVAHELTHYRHGDAIWSVLRCVCLTLHWYNPLVWWAARLSQRDAELCCDAATIRALGEEERTQYGRALIDMTCKKQAGVLLTATTMSAKKSEIKERIMSIAKKPKMAMYTLIAVLLVAAVAVGCTFTGAQETPPSDKIHATDIYPKEENEGTGNTASAIAISELKDFTCATLVWSETATYTETDPDTMAKLETILQRSVPLGYDAGCPFTATLTLKTKSGKTLTLQLATDNCAVWYDGEDYYTYHELIQDWGYTKNDELYSLFFKAHHSS